MLSIYVENGKNSSFFDNLSCIQYIDKIFNSYEYISETKFKRQQNVTPLGQNTLIPPN